MSIMKRIGLSLGIGILLLTGLVSINLALAEVKPAILVCAHTGIQPELMLDEKLAKQLKSWGYESATLAYPDLTWSYLSNFNILVITGKPDERWTAEKCANCFCFWSTVEEYFALVA